MCTLVMENIIFTIYLERFKMLYVVGLFYFLNLCKILNCGAAGSDLAQFPLPLSNRYGCASQDVFKKIQLGSLVRVTMTFCNHKGL